MKLIKYIEICLRYKQGFSFIILFALLPVVMVIITAFVNLSAQRNKSFNMLIHKITYRTVAKKMLICIFQEWDTYQQIGKQISQNFEVYIMHEDAKINLRNIINSKMEIDPFWEKVIRTIAKLEQYPIDTYWNALVKFLIICHDDAGCRLDDINEIVPEFILGQDNLTLHSTGKININKASPIVLQALSEHWKITDIEQLLVKREKQMFENYEQVADYFLNQPLVWNDIKDQIRVDTHFFRIQIRSMLDKTLILDIIVKHEDSGWKIIEWNEL